MSVRKRSWLDKSGQRKEAWQVHVVVELPDGTAREARKTLSGVTRRAAEKYERELREALLEGKRETKEETEETAKTVPTLEEFVEPFMVHQGAENLPSEIEGKRRILDHHLIPAFGKMRLDEIEVLHVDRYKATKLRGLAPETVANHITVLKRMLNQARDWDILDKVPRIKQVKLPRVHEREFDYLDVDECELYLAHAGKWRSLFLVAVRSGLRLGELRGLQWGDVDLEGRRIRVARSYTKQGWGKPKSGKARTVDLSWDAVDELRRIKPTRAGRTDLVFPGPSGQPLDEKAVYKGCQAASKGAGLGRVIGPHDLRHTFASHHVMRGTPVAVIQAWLGHADITTTMRYSHLAPNATASYADNVAPKTLRLVEPAAGSTAH